MRRFGVERISRLDPHAPHQRGNIPAADLVPSRRNVPRSIWLPAKGYSRCGSSVRRMSDKPRTT
jgi:hypothetical protein